LKCSEGSVKATLQQLFRKFGIRKRALIARLVPGGTRTSPYGADSHEAHVDAPAPLDRLANRSELPSTVTSTVTSSEKAIIHAGDFVIDVAKHRAWVRGSELPFSPSEFKLLKFFAEHPEELLQHESLLTTLWGNPTAPRESLRVLIGALRAKIEIARPPRYIVTQPNLGYRFVPSPATD
jgi:two-component system, OmpR family, KDP operon response regulator KdpE